MAEVYQDRLFEVDKRCTKCGEVKPLSEFWALKGGKRSKCKVCDRAENRAWVAKNRDKKREYDKQDRERHREKRAAYQARYFQEHRETLYRQNAEWAAANPEYVRLKGKRHREANPEKHSAYRQNRRALLKNAPGTITVAAVKQMYSEQDGVCFYCGASLEDGYHVDHKTPLSRGGTNEPCNVALACATCNLRKYTKTAEEYLEHLRM